MIHVVIPVFNRPDYTEACLSSLVSIDPGCERHTFVVDNGSRNKTRSVIIEALADSKSSTIRLESNTGFAGAINAYLKSSQFEALSDDDKVVIMHNDTFAVQPGWLAEMVAVHEELAEDDELAAVMPRTCYANEMSVCWPDTRKTFEAIKPNNKDRLLVSEIKALVEKTYEPMGGLSAFMESMRTKEPRYSYSPEIASFCMLCSAGLLKRHGGFDDAFFPRGYEDKLWFLGLERQGLCCHVANRAYVHHFGNITSDGPGFSMPETMKALSELYKTKSRLSY